MDSIIHVFIPFLPLLVAVSSVVVILGALHYWLLAKPTHLTQQQKLPRQVGLLVLTISGLLAIAMSLPVSESTRNQVIALIGVLLSGVIAFSSTTMVGSLMAGLVLRVNKPFRVGDFIKVEGYSGRVAEMGLLDTEIQTETRELIAFSNTYMVNTPVTVTRASGAIVSVDLSLGYDLHHSIVEQHLLSAAKQAELNEPFVQVVALGDFSVSYRVAGLLTEVKSMLSARSRLHKAVLDTLHGAGIEIVSPTFMHQRPQQEGVAMIPTASFSPPQAVAPKDTNNNPESLVFDKAEQAEKEVKSREALTEQITQLETHISHAEGEEKAQLKAKHEHLVLQLEALNTPREDE